VILSSGARDSTASRSAFQYGRPARAWPPSAEAATAGVLAHQPLLGPRRSSQVQVGRVRLKFRATGLEPAAAWTTTSGPVFRVRSHARALTRTEDCDAGCPFGAQTPVNRRQFADDVLRATRRQRVLFAGSLWGSSLPHVLLAMQKVVGSNPISRFGKTAICRYFSAPLSAGPYALLRTL
jgi:hypothetical protein